jgi:hypothetical protein
MTPPAPPAYAWDWLARQRLPWREVRRRLIGGATGQGPDTTARPPASRPSAFPDWSASAAAHLPAARHADVDRPATVGTARRDYAPLDVRGEVIAALREDYPRDAELARTVDAVVAELAFLGRTGGELAELGLRSAPRGLRWWWLHLGGLDAEAPHGPSAAPGRAEPAHDEVPVQLRLVDVQAGYGDH